VLNPDPALCRSLAADLAAARFRSEPMRARWGVEADDAIGRTLRTPALRGLGDAADPQAVLACLLIFGVAQPTAHVDAALPELRASGLVDLGLARFDGDDTVPTAIVRPQSFHDDRGPGEWIIAADLDEIATGGGALAEDHVLGVGGASLTLAGLQLPTATGRVLDLGTGCGVQALRARRYADTVVATDISSRALRFTEMNALINDVTGLDVRGGSLFDPVSGEAFDRIVSNPPFVITPRVAGVPEYEYRDGGLVGDALVEQVVAGAGEHLVPGGTAQFLANWETKDDVAGLDRFRGWVEGSSVPLDAWVIERESLNPIEYAEMWIRDGGTAPGSAEHDRLLNAWLDDFAARGVSEIGFGYVLLRRAAGDPTLARYERVPQPIPSEGALGSHLADALAAHDAQAALGDAELLARRLTTASDVTETRQGGGFGRSVQADPALAGLVGASDGELSVGQIVGALAQLLEVDEQSLTASVLPAVRALVDDGFLRL
jgi:hypothetical protein